MPCCVTHAVSEYVLHNRLCRANNVSRKCISILCSVSCCFPVTTWRTPARACRLYDFDCSAGTPAGAVLPMLTAAAIRQITDLDLMDPKGHPVSLEAKFRLLRFINVTVLNLRYRRDLPLELHAKVSADSVSAMFLCYLLFHSVRPATYLKGPHPAACLYAHAKQIAGMLSGSNKEVAQALSCKAFCSSSTKLAQSMTYPQHIWDQRNFLCCFQAMLDHIEQQMVAEFGAWRLSAPWGHWQATPAYTRHLQSNPLGAAGNVLGIMQSLGMPIDIY